MNSPSREHPVYEDEISLYDYWKVIVKRKKLISGLFIVSVVCAVVVSLLMPQIYRGEVVLNLKLSSKELISIIGDLNREKLKSILPKTHYSVTAVRLNSLKDSTDKLQITIEGKSAGGISDALSEMVEYIKNHPLIKSYIEIEKEKLLKQSEKLSNTIKVSTNVLKTYETLIEQGKIQAIGFNPVSVYIQISDLKIEKNAVDYTIKNLKVVEIIGQPYVSKNPISPEIKKNIALTGLFSLLAGILLSFFIEYLERMKNRS